MTQVQIPITFEASSGERLHSPMVYARVGRISTRLVLDTGSDAHVIVRPLAEAIGLALGEVEPGLDHSGAAVASWQVGAIEVELGPRSWSLEDVVVIPEPPPFAGWGIGGILSPQSIQGEAALVLDLAADELTIDDDPWVDVERRLVARYPSMVPIRVPRRPEFGTVVVDAAVRPYPPVAAVLNTGGLETEFAAAALPGIEATGGRSVGKGVGGGLVVATGAGRRILELGGASVDVADLAVREEMVGLLGLIGMDVLRGTVVACSARRHGQVTWLVPADRGREAEG